MSSLFLLFPVHLFKDLNLLKSYSTCLFNWRPYLFYWL